MAIHYEPLRTSDPIADAERYSNRDIPIRGKCSMCKEDIPTWDIYYEIDGELICDNCINDYIAQFRKNSDY